MKRKIAIINGSRPYQELFIRIGFDIIQNAEAADLVCFTGGSDVTPELYGHKPHPTTYSDRGRDVAEKQVYESCLNKSIPMVGICRGGQLLNVMNGGTMFQDVTNHTRSHYLYDHGNNNTVFVTSTHHQMMNPSNKAIVVGIAMEGGSRTYWDGEQFVTQESDTDYEVLFYPESKSLCFQPHPEMYQGYDQYAGMRNYFQHLVESKLF